MKVKISLRGSRSHLPTDDVQVVADATATVGDVAATLAHSDRRAGQWSSGRDLTLRLLPSSGQAVTLSAEATLLESGITSGSTVEIAFAEKGSGTAGQGDTAAVLRILAGPDAGRDVMLPLGSSTVGRAAGNDVVLTDPLVSKHHCRIVVGNRVELIDTASSNGVVVGGVRAPRIALAPGETAELGDTHVTVVSVRPGGTETTSTDVGHVRQPVVLVRPAARSVDLPDVPRETPRQRFPWLALAAPLLMGVVIVLSGVRLGVGIAFIALSPLLMIGSFVDQRIQGRRQQRAELEAFRSLLRDRRDELTTAHQLERDALLRLHPSVSECLTAADRRGDRLWSRRPEHPEYLQVRLGLGEIAPMVVATAPRHGGLPHLVAEAQAVADGFATLPQAPVVTDLRSVGGLGVCGGPSVAGVARGLVAQVATLHSPSELVLACLTSTEERHRWDWLQWLPHTSSPHSPLEGPHLAAEPGTGTVLLNSLEELISSRTDGAASLRGPLLREESPAAPIVPTVLLVVDGTSVDPARLTRIAEAGPDVGVHVLWVAPGRSLLPAACRAYLQTDTSGGDATVGLVRQGLHLEGVTCETVGEADALRFARRLAPLFDAGAPVDDQSDLPRSVSVVSLVGHEAADDAAVILGRWRENHSLVVRDGPPVTRERDGDLVAVLGHAGTEQFTLDLRSQGPHALVGGTTGSGKSEFLQAWVLGLAHAYSPDRVSFLFVDYKGGAAFATCTDLPHTVGLVTDLSPYLVRRALRSLRAELHFRERLLNEKGKKDLLELERTGDPDCPPSLVIVVDEFAALVGEVPEFVDGVVDVAQRGRSLGLHLVLATQRPAGVIKENLRANTNLRIALRMADESDSLDVLGDQMAAHFPASIPGRGGAKTGPGRITQFQSAFPGARTPLVAEAPPIEVADLDFGPGRPWKTRATSRPTDRTVEKDIDRVVTSIRGAAALGGVPAPRKPWLESLAATYSLSRLGPRRDTALPLGVLDDPDRQQQVQEFFRPDDDGNIVFFGAGGSGKTTALRTLAVAAGITPGGGVAHVYGIDLGGGSLAAVEVLPHVGSIVNGEDEERTRRLLRRLTDMAEERAARYRAVAASTLTEYRANAAAPDEPRILLLMDGFSAFRNAYDGPIEHLKLYQQFQRLLVDGRSVGIHVAITADRPNAVPISILSAFPRRVVLRQADEEAYAALGVPRDVLGPSSPPGRALQVDNPQELQLAVFVSDRHAGKDVTSNAAQVSAMERLAVSLADRHSPPAPVTALPSEVLASELPADLAGRPVLGISDETLEPMAFDATGVVLVAGAAQSGRTNAVHWLASVVGRCFPDARLVHLSARRTPLSALDLWDRTADDQTDAAALLDDLAPLAAQQASPGAPSLAVFVEFLPELVGTPVEQSLVTLIGVCRRNGHLVVAEGETPGWSAPWPLLMEVRNARTGLLLQPDQADGDTLLRTSLPRTKRADLPPGRGFWIRAGRAHKLQVPLVDVWDAGHPVVPGVEARGHPSGGTVAR